MLLTLDRFVREYCVRKKDQLTNPPVHDIKNFILPRNAQLHFTEQEADGSVGILANNPMIQYNDKGKIVSEFIIGYKTIFVNHINISIFKQFVIFIQIKIVC